MLAEVDEQGEVKANHRCDVWGSDRLLNPGDPKSKHAFVGNLGHTSGDTPGLIYMRARWYDPTVGRFISEDPAGNGKNWYAYCGNNPVNAMDPDGRIPSPYSPPPLVDPALWCWGVWMALSLGAMAFGLGLLFSSYEGPSYLRIAIKALGTTIALTGAFGVLVCFAQIVEHLKTAVRESGAEERIFATTTLLKKSGWGGAIAGHMIEVAAYTEMTDI